MNEEYTVYTPTCPTENLAAQDLAKNLPKKGNSKCKGPKAAKELAEFREQPGKTQFGVGGVLGKRQAGT